MYVLGLSFGYHDSSATLVKDGEVVAYSSEERLTRQKHDPNFPKQALQFCLNKAEIKISDIDHVVYHEDPYAKFSRVLLSSLSGFPHTRKEFVNSMRTWLSGKLWSLNSIRRKIGKKSEIHYLSHHYSHAVQAFMGSGQERSAILVVDAVGDWLSTSSYLGRWEDGKPVVTNLQQHNFLDSLGLVYSAVTAYLGFNPNDSECSTMALAAFGQPKYLKEFREIIKWQNNKIKVDQSYFNFVTYYKGSVRPKFIECFGEPRPSGHKLPFSCFDKSRIVDEDSQRWADIAASLQRVTEECVVGLAQDLQKTTGESHLCYSGGVSLNCVANKKILEQSNFKNIFIPPDPGDGGTSLGAALFLSHRLGPGHGAIPKYENPYLGASYEEQVDRNTMQRVKASHLSNYRIENCLEDNVSNWQALDFASDSECCHWVAQALEEGKIIGWFQGAYEAGPRALGNRSLLIRPDDFRLANKLSKKVKLRSNFRPYAFSVLEDNARDILNIPESVALEHYRWMQIAAEVKQPEKVQGALHIDGTSRPHICFQKENPKYYELLTEFRRRTGIGALLNTSFNPRGYPIVASPVDAHIMFSRTAMDVVVVNNSAFVKQEGSNDISH